MKYRFIVHARDNEGTEELYVSSVIEDTGSVTLYPNDVRSVHIDEMESAEVYLADNGVDIQEIIDYKEANNL